MKKAIGLLLFCGIVLGQASQAHGQSPMEQAVAASFPLTKASADRNDIVTAGAVMTLKKDHVIMFATTAANRSSLNYKDGKISPSLQTRMLAFGFTGRPSTNIAQRTYVAGEKLWLIGIEPGGDGLTLQFLSDPVGDTRYATSIKFPFPKGTTPTSQQMVAEIGEVIAPDGGAAPGPPPPPAAPAEAPIVAPPPPGGGVSASSSLGAWRITSVKDGGTEAMIVGTGSSAEHSESVVLNLSCTGSKSDWYSRMEVRVRRKAISNLSPMGFDCGAGPAGYKSAYVALGSQPEQNVKVCDQTSTETGPYFFQIYPSDAWLKTFVDNPGARVAVRIREDKVDNLLASFALPNDGVQVQQMMAACFQTSEAQHKKYLATVVISCPTVAGKTVSNVEVLTATGKAYHSPHEEDEMDDGPGLGWVLPKATKAHPIVPKLTLQCTYGTGEAEAPASTVTATVRRLPIPERARNCSFVDDIADCTK